MSKSLSALSAGANTRSISDRYTIDAKSIMGIFSLDLSKPIQMNVHADECDSFLNEISRFLKD